MRWRVLVVAVAGLAAVVPLPPDLVERYYSTLLYPWIQRTLTGLSNLTELALLDLLIAAAATMWLALLVRDVLTRRGRRARRPLIRLVVRTGTAAACLYLLFLATWGLNYRRLPLARKLDLDAASVSPRGALDLATMAVAEINRLYPLSVEPARPRIRARTHRSSGPSPRRNGCWAHPRWRVRAGPSTPGWIGIFVGSPSTA